jgi:hypothetical protein
MTLPRSFAMVHSQADPIWPGGTFKLDKECGQLYNSIQEIALPSENKFPTPG